jgi:hypothetical protein
MKPIVLRLPWLLAGLPFVLVALNPAGSLWQALPWAVAECALAGVVLSLALQTALRAPWVGLVMGLAGLFLINRATLSWLFALAPPLFLASLGAVAAALLALERTLAHRAMRRAAAPSSPSSPRSS